jgi:hypothetical protein
VDFVAGTRSDHRRDHGTGSAAANAIFERLRVQLVAKLGIPEYRDEKHEGQIAT